MRLTPILAAGLLLAAAPAALAQPAAATQAAALRDKALAGEHVGYAVTESLTTEVGARPTGSPAMERARDWGVAKLKALGFTEVKVEPFAKTAWVRGEEKAEVVAPAPQSLAVLGLGYSVPTPPGGLEAELAIFPTLEALQAAPEAAVRGKIAMVNLRMPETQDGSGYGYAGRARRLGASVAGRKGAVAFLVRSITADEGRDPHTGVQSYAEGAPRVPCAAVSPADADQLARLAALGKPVRLKLNLQSREVAGTAWNISGEIKGTAKPEEVIVIGGHLDSWDQGTGALDDAAGIGITVAAAKLVADQPGRPRRTIRVVLWGSEETGGSSDAYLAAHRDELPRIVLAGESDSGADRVFQLNLPRGAVAAPAFAALPGLMAPLGVVVSPEPARQAGVDVQGLEGAGVPVLNLRQDVSRYFDHHHTPNDTLDKVDRAQLNQNVAAWAAVLSLVANTDVDFRAIAAAAQPAGAAAR